MSKNEHLAKKSVSPWLAMGMVWDVLIAIAVPTVIFGLGGRYLDKKLGTGPLFLILGLAFSLVTVSVIVNKKAKEIASKL